MLNRVLMESLDFGEWFNSLRVGEGLNQSPEHKHLVSFRTTEGAWDILLGLVGCVYISILGQARSIFLHWIPYQLCSRCVDAHHKVFSSIGTGFISAATKPEDAIQECGLHWSCIVHFPEQADWEHSPQHFHSTALLALVFTSRSVYLPHTSKT